MSSQNCEPTIITNDTTIERVDNREDSAILMSSFYSIEERQYLREFICFVYCMVLQKLD